MKDKFISLGDYDVEIIKGSGGVFDIVVDGELVFSKKQLGRFPEDQEIEEITRQANTAD